MRTQIVNVCKLQTSKVMAALYLVVSLPFSLFYMIMSITSMHGGGAGTWTQLALFPLLYAVLYAVFGFIFTFFGAWVYNGIARKIGGIQFTVENQ